MTNTNPQLTGAEILWATLTGEGVTTVFGYPGGAIVPIDGVLVRREQGAAHIAYSYLRLHPASNETPKSHR